METQTDLTTCYHCGASTEGAPIVVDGKAFCCTGCSTVYEMLQESGLDNFYNLEDKPGVRSYRLEDDRFSWLDEPEVESSIVKFKDETQSLVTFFIPDIHCASCVWLLEKLPHLKEHILRSEVDFLRKEVRVWFDHNHLSIRKVVELLALIGYEPTINLDSSDSKPSNYGPLRRTYLKLGLAGFAFGNVMLFSLPDYFGLDVFTPSMVVVFTWLNALLSIPVLVFSAEEFWKSAWASVRGKRITMDVPITLGIIAMFSRSVYELVTQTGTGYFDSFTGLIFFMLIGRLFQQKTYHAISFFRDYRSYFPMSVYVKSGTSFNAIPLQKLNKGDVIRVRNEELIPSDAQLISERAHIDYHFVTGESEPIELKKKDEVYAGGRLKGTEAEFLVRNNVDQSYLTQLWNHDVFKKDKLSNHVSFGDRISPYFTWVIVVIAIAGFFFWLNIDSASKAAEVLTAVLIIACPCALALSTPFTFGSIMNIFSKNGFYLRSERLIDKLAQAATLVFDKTGTLTDAESSDVNYLGKSINSKQKKAIASIASSSSHPIAKNIHQYLMEDELPKASKLIEVQGKGVLGEVDGLIILMGNMDWFNENHIEVQDYLGGSTKTYLAINGELYGAFIIEQKVRTGISSLIDRLKASKVKLVGMSGDVKPKSGEIKHLFDQFNDSHFECKPEEKLNKVLSLDKHGERQVKVMVGDGLNDAGALRAAEVGLAVSDDVHSFSPGCDGILKGDSLNKLDKFIQLSKDSIKVIYASYTISLIYNVVGIGFALSGLLSPLITAILMPLSSLTVLVFTTGLSYIYAVRRGVS